MTVDVDNELQHAVGWSIVVPTDVTHKMQITSKKDWIKRTQLGVNATRQTATSADDQIHHSMFRRADLCYTRQRHQHTVDTFTDWSHRFSSFRRRLRSQRPPTELPLATSTDTPQPVSTVLCLWTSENITSTSWESFAQPTNDVSLPKWLSNTIMWLDPSEVYWMKDWHGILQQTRDHKLNSTLNHIILANTACTLDLNSETTATNAPIYYRFITAVRWQFSTRRFWTQSMFRKCA